MSVHAVLLEDLVDPRMQNVAVLAVVSARGLVPGVRPEHCEQAMNDLLKRPALESNLELFRKG